MHPNKNIPLPTNCSSSKTISVSKPRTKPAPTRPPICLTARLERTSEMPNICFRVTVESSKLYKCNISCKASGLPSSVFTSER